MNIADRSIATIDNALRRRFQFKEMQPDVDVLNGIIVDNLSIKDILFRMNECIEVLYDREHTIGHTYFLRLKNKNKQNIEVLADIFKNNIIPLLQEYFYEEYEKIRLVLGDNKKTKEEEMFIISKNTNYDILFGNTDCNFDESKTYEINEKVFMNIESYRSI
jgi:5-methylcytosine-specific restriction endonuclease McrBC GTP-binding regulatory subunit McrB